MNQTTPNFRKAFLLLLFLSLLIAPGAALAGSAAQIPSQVEILQDMSRSSQERSAAAEELGIVGLDSNEAAQALYQTLQNDSDPNVRASAAEALGMVGLPAGGYIQALIQALQYDASPAVRSAAAKGLRIIGADSAAAKQALENAAENDSNAEVRRIASKMYNLIKSND